MSNICFFRNRFFFVILLRDHFSRNTDILFISFAFSSSWPIQTYTCLYCRIHFYITFCFNLPISINSKLTIIQSLRVDINILILYPLTSGLSLESIIFLLSVDTKCKYFLISLFKYGHPKQCDKTIRRKE